MRTKAPTWEHPRFTVLDLELDPDDPADCIHGWPAHLATIDGWPRCAECRHRLKRIKGETAPSTPSVPPLTGPHQDELALSPADRAAGAHLED